MITGTITLKDGTVIDMDDSRLVSNSLKVTMSTCSASSFDIGTFNSGNMSIKIYDDEALEHEFDGAVIALNLSENEAETPLGIYLVDGTQTKRKKNVVTLYASDYSVKFDEPMIDELRTSTYSAQPALNSVCSAVGVTLATSDFSKFCNTYVTFTPASSSIQTLRDYVMWIAQLICGNAVINRNGELEIRPAGYQQSDGNIVVDYQCTAENRVSIQFSDVRTYIKYLSAYSEGAPKDYTSDLAVTDEQARAACFNMLNNPLMDGVGTEACDTVNNNWLEQIDGFAQRQIKAVLYSKPSLKLGDTVRFSGGSIDVRRSIIGVITGIEWKYHGYTTITCAAPQAAKN